MANSGLKKINRITVSTAITNTSEMFDLIKDLQYDIYKMYVMIIRGNEATDQYAGVSVLAYRGDLANNTTSRTFCYCRKYNAATTASTSLVFNVSQNSTIDIYEVTA